MPSSPSPLDRLRPAVLTGRLWSAVLWGTAALLFAGVTLGLGVLTVVGSPPSTASRIVLNVSALALGVLLYGLLGRTLLRRTSADPVRALWRPLLIALGLMLGLYALPVLVGPGFMNPGTGLPEKLSMATVAAGVALVNTVVAALLLLYLRGLVLFRRTRTTLRNWRLMLGGMVVASLSSVALAPHEGTTLVGSLFAVGAFFLLLLNVFRLGWIASLSLRRKLITVAFAVGLVGVLVSLLIRQFTGPGAVQGAFDGMPYFSLFSRSLGDLILFAYGFGILYALAAALSLLFHLPTTRAYAQRTGEIQAFRTLAELSTQVLEPQRLATTIAAAPVDAGLADAAWLALIDPRSGSLAPRVVAATGASVDQATRVADAAALTGDAAEAEAPLVLGAAAADHRVRARPGDGLGSLVILPLTAGGQTYGALFASRAITDGFEADDVGALGTFAGQAALALSHAALFVEALEKERLARELALAREVQQRLLPQSLPDVDGAELAAAEHSASEVCGDYYDIVALGEGCYGLLVADVAGKGAAAAFYMAELKGIVQSTARLTRSPGEFLAGANEALADSLGRKAFISAIYGVLDTQNATFTFARAGHCPVVMARQDGEHWLLRADGLGLGLDHGPLFRRTLHEQVVRLEPGDVFALYTDGLVEARSEGGQEFGYDRLTEVICRHRADSADEVLTAILAEQQGFAGSMEHEDDTTVIVLKWTGLAPDSSDDAPESTSTASSNGEAPFIIRPAFA
ncbi:MAG: SpoIIE family protein phosphatase [Rhodothermaceae bacterium]|nr:SpoIIE family protein phosphatase [Rhodothermaceae bacterium]